MPSNKQLKKEIDELSADLDIHTNTADLSNSELSDLLSDLRAKHRDAELDTQADADADALPAYYIAPGKALTSRKGILSGDTRDEIKPEYLSGGQEAIDAFVKSGHILKG